MAILESFRSLIDGLFNPVYDTLPPSLREAVERYVEENENIILTLRTIRAIYKAPSFRDSNIYYSSWFVLTSSRVIVLRNASTLKKFREIPLQLIEHIEYEFEREESKLTITSANKVDIMEFHNAAYEPWSELKAVVQDTLKAGAAETPTTGVDHMFCGMCGTKIPSTSKFCFSCGAEVKTV